MANAGITVIECRAGDAKADDDDPCQGRQAAVRAVYRLMRNRPMLVGIHVVAPRSLLRRYYMDAFAPHRNPLLRRLAADPPTHDRRMRVEIRVCANAAAVFEGLYAYQRERMMCEAALIVDVGDGDALHGGAIETLAPDDWDRLRVLVATAQALRIHVHIVGPVRARAPHWVSAAADVCLVRRVSEDASSDGSTTLSLHDCDDDSDSDSDHGDDDDNDQDDADDPSMGPLVNDQDDCKRKD